MRQPRVMVPTHRAEELHESHAALHETPGEQALLAERRGFGIIDPVKLLNLFGLERDTEAPMSAFSKGMRQKVLLSAALLHDPEIIILDEPSSGLDVAFTLILRRLVMTLAARGKTIIYSSHESDMVEKICNHVVILHKGHVVAHDSVTRLRELVHAASLEEVFASLAVDQDVDRIGHRWSLVGDKGGRFASSRIGRSGKTRRHVK